MTLESTFNMSFKKAIEKLFSKSKIKQKVTDIIHLTAFSILLAWAVFLFLFSFEFNVET